MKIYKTGKEEIDARLSLNKLHDQRAFCHYFDSEESLPPDFYLAQDNIRDGLEAVLNSNYENGGVWEWNLFYISAELLLSERILIEMSSEILDDKLIGLILSYLEKNAASYCVIVSIYRGMHKGSDYLGRLVMNVCEIAVETSLGETWNKQIKLWGSVK